MWFQLFKFPTNLLFVKILKLCLRTNKVNGLLVLVKKEHESSETVKFWSKHRNNDAMNQHLEWPLSHTCGHVFYCLYKEKSSLATLMSRKSNTCYHDLLITRSTSLWLYTFPGLYIICMPPQCWRKAAICMRGFIVAASWNVSCWVQSAGLVGRRSLLLYGTTCTWVGTCPTSVSSRTIEQEHIFQKANMWQCAVNGPYINPLFT